MNHTEGGADRPVVGLAAPPLLRLLPLEPAPPEPADVRWLAAELAARLGTEVEVEPAMAAAEGWLAIDGSQLLSGAIVDTLIELYPEDSAPPSEALPSHPEGDAASAAPPDHPEAAAASEGPPDHPEAPAVSEGPPDHPEAPAVSEVPPSHPEGAAVRRRPNGSPGGSTWVLALTAADLRGGGRPFVFGEAAQGGRWAVMGSARFGARGDPRFRERLLKEALHELGHLAGLAHCVDPDCLMAPSADAAAIDRKGASLCAGCRRSVDRAGT